MDLRFEETAMVLTRRINSVFDFIEFSKSGVKCHSLAKINSLPSGAVSMVLW